MTFWDRNERRAGALKGDILHFSKIVVFSQEYDATETVIDEKIIQRTPTLNLAASKGDNQELSDSFGRRHLRQERLRLLPIIRLDHL